MTDFFNKIFKKTNKTVTKTWMIDDGTYMPIACETYEQAVDVVNTYFDGKVERIYSI